MQSTQWHLNTINAYNAWNIQTGNPDVIVAVLDSGTDWKHEDLGFGTDAYQNMYINEGEDEWNNSENLFQGDGVDNDNNGYIDDRRGWNFASNNNSPLTSNRHGTEVAGIIGAKSNNNKGVSGLAGGWNNQGAKILPVCVGSNFPMSVIIDDAIIYAAQNGAKIVQLSLSMPYSQAVSDAIDYVYDNYGTTIVCSSGNLSSNAIQFPASHSKVISVGGTTQNDERMPISNYGTNLFITAPGTNIKTTIMNNSYGTDSGTSLAAPIVSGVIALMYSANPCLTQNQVKMILKTTAEKVGGYNYNWDSNNSGHSQELGYGRINAYLAVQLAQQMNASSVDLMIKDSHDDLGVQPNMVTQYMWTSEDIWVRNSNDNGLEHLNPEYNSAGSPNYVYVRVINKGCTESEGNENLKVYWAKAATSLTWPQNWNGTLNIFNPNLSQDIPLGQQFGTKQIPVLQPGQEMILKFPWVVPNPDDYSTINTEPWHFCLLARIEANLDPIYPLENYDLNSNVRNNNNIAWKNVTVVNNFTPNPVSGEVKMGGVIAVGNPFHEPHTFYLELVKENLEAGKPIFEEAEVGVKMDDILYKAWERGGKIAQEVNATTDEKKKIVKGNNVILDNIAFNGDERGTLNLTFNFLTKELTEKSKFVYHVIQKDNETGAIIGGETYVIKKQDRTPFIADAGGDIFVDKNEIITISATQINEAAIYNWYDADGKLVFTGKDLTIATEIATKYKLEVIATIDGFKDYTEVNVNFKPNTLDVIAPNPASNTANISYKLNEVNSAYLMVLGSYGTSGTSNNYILDVNSSNINIDLSNYQNGFYTIALICNGQIADAKILIKQ